MRYWLFKTEPGAYSIDDLVRDRSTAWTGVRNYQARNFMRDDMAAGDGVFFYHSSCETPGIVGLAEVSRLAYPDATQFDPDSKYFDPKATREKPRWFNVDIRLVMKIPPVPLVALKQVPELSNMAVLQKGNRLSITPVEEREWQCISQMILCPK